MLFWSPWTVKHWHVKHWPIQEMKFHCTSLIHIFHFSPHLCLHRECLLFSESSSCSAISIVPRRQENRCLYWLLFHYLPNDAWKLMRRTPQTESFPFSVKLVYRYFFVLVQKWNNFYEPALFGFWKRVCTLFLYHHTYHKKLPLLPCKKWCFVFIGVHLWAFFSFVLCIKQSKMDSDYLDVVFKGRICINVMWWVSRNRQ